MIERRRFFGGMAAAVAGLFGVTMFKAKTGKAGTPHAYVFKTGALTINEVNREVQFVPPDHHALLPNPRKVRIRAEKDRLNEALRDPATPPDRWLQCYAAQQALAWAIDPEMALSPCKTIAEDRVQLAMSWHAIGAATPKPPQL